jgi:hypothetical protein
LLLHAGQGAAFLTHWKHLAEATQVEVPRSARDWRQIAADKKSAANIT